MGVKTFEERLLELKEEFLRGLQERGASRDEAMSELHVKGHATDICAERRVFGEAQNLRAVHLRSVGLVPVATRRLTALGGVG